MMPTIAVKKRQTYVLWEAGLQLCAQAPIYNVERAAKLCAFENFTCSVDKGKRRISAVPDASLQFNAVPSKKIHKKHKKRLTQKAPTHINRFIESGRAAGGGAFRP